MTRHRLAVDTLTRHAMAEAEFAGGAAARDDVAQALEHRGRALRYRLAVDQLTGAPRIRVWRSKYDYWWRVDVPVPARPIPWATTAEWAVRSARYRTAEQAWDEVAELLDGLAARARAGAEPPC